MRCGWRWDINDCAPGSDYDSIINLHMSTTAMVGIGNGLGDRKRLGTNVG
jgi:hypothetical protein